MKNNNEKHRRQMKVVSVCGVFGYYFEVRSAEISTISAPMNAETVEKAALRVLLRKTKTLEGRVALVPAAADVWSSAGTRCGSGDAGIKSGFKDAQYTQLGVHIAPDAAALDKAS